MLELLPGGAKKYLSAAQAKALLSTVRPRDAVGKTVPPHMTWPPPRLPSGTIGWPALPEREGSL